MILILVFDGLFNADELSCIDQPIAACAGINHKIAGTGSHEELSQTCPVYQKLYESQAEWYR